MTIMAYFDRGRQSFTISSTTIHCLLYIILNFFDYLHDQTQECKPLAHSFFGFVSYIYPIP